MEKAYQPIPVDEEKHASENEALVWGTEKRTIPQAIFEQDTKLLKCLVWFCHLAMFSTSIGFFAASYCMQSAKLSDISYTRQFSPYSPAASVVEYRSVRYNITPILDRTDFVGYGPEVDAAWDHVTYDVGDQMITRQELDRLGLDPNSLKVANPRTGEEGYRVGIQVFHQLHCLNLLRQDSYREYYSHTGGDIDVEPEDLRGHIDHCIEVLRTNIMCQSDIGVFAFRYYDGFEGHWPDFSTLHTCRNFDAIRDWAFEHAVAFGDEE